MWARAAAILIGIAAMTGARLMFSAAWYWQDAVGLMAYFIVRYVAYFVRERRLLAKAMDDARMEN